MPAEPNNILEVCMGLETHKTDSEPQPARMRSFEEDRDQKGEGRGEGRMKVRGQGGKDRHIYTTDAADERSRVDL